MDADYTMDPSLVRDGLNRCTRYSEFARRGPSSTASLARLVLFAFVLSVCSLAAASTVYWQFTRFLPGDTVAVSDLNDVGVILYTGFGDRFPGGGSAIGRPPSYDYEFVQGYGIFPPLYNSLAGVQITDINDVGDAYGSAIRPDGVRVPTIWIGGVPFDLTDPANAGLHFNIDPGPKYINNFDLWSLPIVGLPFTQNPDIQVSPWALTNARQDYVIHLSGPWQADLYALLTAVVPEPGTLVLVLAGMAAALLVARGRVR